MKFVHRSEAWYIEQLRLARMFITGNLVLDCALEETDRQCADRHRTVLLAAIDGVLAITPDEAEALPTSAVPSPLSPSAVRLEQCALHAGSPMTLLLLGSFHAAGPVPTVCPNCEEAKKHSVV